VLEGETPAAHSRRCQILRGRRRNCRAISNKRKTWKSNDTIELRHIVETYPELYLDEKNVGLEVITEKVLVSITNIQKD